MTGPLRRSDFLYDLPPERIAQRPADRREDSRMMVLRRGTRAVDHCRFRDIGGELRPGDLLVLNDTRVIPARLFGHKRGGGAAVEILLLRPLEGDRWKALVRPGRRLPPGARVDLPGGASAEIAGRGDDGSREITLSLGMPLADYLDIHGVTPLPPYIRRPGDADEAFHRGRYQTVYAEAAGSVAAPTAGLHFTPEILDALERAGVETVRITLHVGPGTFRPVQVEDIRRHRMDAEPYTISAPAAERIEAARTAGRRVVAVGTTVTRTLEAVAAAHDGRIPPGSGWTDLFIHPGFRFQVIGALLTNFHLPGSTLLMLVAALAGREWVLDCYREAVTQGYRFYSYGDCMLVL
jgi:S-adenosylmethionine:tRNA ribosyltransferase-isomerase